MSEKFKTRKGQKPVRLASTSGHVVIVGEDWADVPEQLVQEALGHGLLSYELYEAALQEAKASQPGGNPAGAGSGGKQEGNEMSETERKTKVLLAVQKVLEMNEAGEASTPGGKGLVTSTGTPKVEAVSEFAGFKVAAAEIEEALR